MDKKDIREDTDRIVVCDIIGEMLDNPDEYGIYDTTRAFDKLCKYIADQRQSQ